MTIRDDVLATTEAMALYPSEDAVVEHLVDHGYSRLQAELLMVFVPMGLARAVIRRIPVSEPFVLPEDAIVQDLQGNHFRVRLLDVPEFVTALEMGEETFLTGIIPREQFAASCRSVEMNLVNQMLHENVEIGGSVFSPSILLRLSEAPGFTEWYQGITAGQEM